MNETARNEAEYLTRLRREFHAHPELALEETWTASRIEKELDALDIPHQRVGATGVLGKITGERAGEGSIALRADIDGLPVHETLNVPYRSTQPGVMHACGHDAHITALLGAARNLTQVRNAFAGEVKLIFQPAEETGYGARDFIEAGHLDGVERAFAMHAASYLPVGSVAVVEGLNFAAVDHFVLTVGGKGAHVSRPQEGSDALFIASQIVVAAQGLITRRTDPVEPVILGIGKLHAGTAYNALAQTAHIEGTTRTVTDESRIRIRNEFLDLARAIASSYGADIDVTWREVTPAVINPATVSAEVSAVVERIATLTRDRPYSLGGDNFAEFQQVVPGVYAYFGTGNPSVPNSQNSHHNGNFDMDEAALPLAASVYAEYALWWLGEGRNRA